MTKTKGKFTGHTSHTILPYSIFVPVISVRVFNMPSTPEAKKKTLTRVRRIRGQIDALERALDEGEECRAILQQIAAVRGAVNGLMAEVLESHIRETFDGTETDSRQLNTSVNDTIGLVRAYLK